MRCAQKNLSNCCSQSCRGMRRLIFNTLQRSPSRFLWRVKKDWRKAVGVEPTRERLPSPTGFEARPHHRVRLPSKSSPMTGEAAGRAVSLPDLRLRGQGAVGSHLAFVAEAAGEADAVEVFEQLDAAFATELDLVAEGGGADHAGLAFHV